MRRKEPAAEAKKAEGVNWVALQIASPPDQTGKDAWVQAVHYPKGLC